MEASGGRHARIHIGGFTTSGLPPQFPPPLEPPMAMLVSRADREFINEAIRRSNRLAEERGHVNVWRK